MSIGFFIIGGLIFSVYVGLTAWNIFYSHRKQKEENYPNLDSAEAFRVYESSQSPPDGADKKKTEL
jgi:hypothetical protein